MPIAKISREFHLAARPTGTPQAENFVLVERPVADHRPGEVVVANTYLSVDPYMRGRMVDAPSYVPPWQLGVPLDGDAIGVVVASAADGLAVGSVVEHQFSWREVAVGEATQFTPLDVDAIAPSAYLGVLGIPGLTAWIGVNDIAAMRPGETVFISGAAGAVGSAAGQIARLRGAGRVIGSAGSSEKVAYLRNELGFDAAFDYNDGPISEQLAAAAPHGVDVFFDNVGGEHLEAAIGALNHGARIALCGAIAGYNDLEPAPGPRNLYQLTVRRGRAEGFLVIDHLQRMAEFRAEASGWLRAGNLRSRETIVEGIESMPDAFLGLFRGDNLGKMVVRLDG